VKRRSEARVPKATTKKANNKVRVEPVNGTELLKPDTYVATYGFKNLPKHYAFAVRELRNPVHPEAAVHYFAEVLREKGLNPQETWCHVSGLNHGGAVTFAEWVTTASELFELEPLVAQVKKLSKTQVNRVTRKGFKK
jgi:hypothetical protein